MFYIHTTDDGRNPPFEYLPCSAIAPKIGQAMTLNTSGQLALATGATKPTYISMCETATAVEAGTVIPVIRVAPDIIFETTASAAITSIKPGNKLTIHTDASQVTATTTDGVAEVVETDGTAAGSKVRVRFV